MATERTTQTRTSLPPGSVRVSWGDRALASYAGLMAYHTVRSFLHASETVRPRSIPPMHVGKPYDQRSLTSHMPGRRALEMTRPAPVGAMVMVKTLGTR